MFPEIVYEASEFSSPKWNGYDHFPHDNLDRWNYLSQNKWTLSHTHSLAYWTLNWGLIQKVTTALVAVRDTALNMSDSLINQENISEVHQLQMNDSDALPTKQHSNTLQTTGEHYRILCLKLPNLGQEPVHFE